MPVKLLKMIAMSLLFFHSLEGLSATGSASFEKSCRSQAKIAAAEKYKGCMTEARSAELNSIRESYQAELRALKQKYEGRLTKLSGAAATETTIGAPAQEVSDESLLPEPIPLEP